MSMKLVNNTNSNSKKILMAKRIIENLKESQFFRQALTHTSYCHENNSATSYETLEFLGDSILNFYTSLFIYDSFPHYSEGQMSRLRQSMVKEKTLAILSKEVGLGKHLWLGAGEEKNQGREKESILSDVFESFIAALYLEKGGKSVHRFLSFTLFDWIKGKENLIWDYKTQLQEWCQARKIKINYQEKGLKIEKQQRIFVIEVKINSKSGTFREIGEGHSKKEGQQQAAAKMFERLGLGKEKN